MSLRFLVIVLLRFEFTKERLHDRFVVLADISLHSVACSSGLVAVKKKRNALGVTLEAIISNFPQNRLEQRDLPHFATLVEHDLVLQEFFQDSCFVSGALRSARRVAALPRFELTGAGWLAVTNILVRLDRNPNSRRSFSLDAFRGHLALRTLDEVRHAATSSKVCPVAFRTASCLV